MNTEKYIVSIKAGDDWMRVGSVSLRTGGWFFVTQMPARRGSIKPHPTANAALPRWVTLAEHKVEAV